MPQIARLLITLGIVLILAGIIFYFLPKITRLPRLPGDIFIQRENFTPLESSNKIKGTSLTGFTFYFPITTSIIISIILGIIFWLWTKR